MFRRITKYLAFLVNLMGCAVPLWFSLWLSRRDRTVLEQFRELR